MRIGIVAGEASGDLLAAGLIQELKKKYPQAQFEGIAGPLMQAQGCRALFPQEKLAVLGLTEILRHLREILSIRKQLFHHFLDNPPDIFIGVDAPEFNTTLELKLKQKGIKTVHYVSPTVWAWRQYRLKKIARAVDLMLTLFPFEARFYEGYGLKVQFVGHPLANDIPMVSDARVARQQLGLGENAKVVAILPGSRMSEVHNLLEDFLETAQLCANADVELQFVIAASHDRVRAHIEQVLAKRGDKFKVSLVEGKTQTVMAASDVILLASGTATLEAMLVKRPMVVAYRVSPLTAWIARKFLKIDTFALPNLLAGRDLVPEFIQEQINPAAMAEKVLEYLHNKTQSQELVEIFSKLHHELQRDASQVSAQAVTELIGKNG